MRSLKRPMNSFSVCLALAAVLLAACAGLPAGAAEVPAQTETSPEAEPSLASATGPRDLLRQYGIDESHFDNLMPGRPVNTNEEETLLDIMFQLRECSVQDIEDWARAEFPLAQLAADPKPGRGEIYGLSGRVTAIKVRRPDAPEIVNRVELSQYYRCEIMLDEGRQPAVVFVPTVPKAWRGSGPLHEPISVFGLLLKFSSDDSQHPKPVFVARRIAWHGNTLLGKLGMDVGLLDEVRDQTPVAHLDLARAKRMDWERAEWERQNNERECFYQMLGAVGRAKPGQILRAANRRLAEASQSGSGQEKLVRPDGDAFSVEPLFNQPEKERGKLVVLSGNARRVERIRVEDPDVVERLGIDHYYQIAMFTPDSQNNPVFFCVRQLPKGMPLTEEPEYNEQVRIAGFLMKTWAFDVPSLKGAANDGSGRTPKRVAPLLFGRQPVWIRPGQSPGNPLLGWIGGGLFLIVLVGAWLALWLHGRKDKQSRLRQSRDVRVRIADQEAEPDGEFPADKYSRSPSQNGNFS